MMKHPWLQEELPQFSEMLGHRKIEKQNPINEEIFSRLLALRNNPNINFHYSSEEKIRDAIIKKKDFSFVTVYELMLDDYKKSSLKSGKPI